VPAPLVGLTGKQMYAQYGLAIGGIVAPADATASNPRIDGLIGSKSTYLPDVQLLSKKYFNNSALDYKLVFKYFDPTGVGHDKSGYVTVKETAATPLSNGWNLITRQVLGVTRTMMVFADSTPPTFVLNANVLTTINQADLDNGSTFVVEGKILDNSFGSMNFRQSFKLNDPKYVSALQTDAKGSFVVLSFIIKDFAGNAYQVNLRLDVSATSTLIKDVGRKLLPTITPSITLKALITAP
jgi:hypothetical protein